MKHEQPAWKYLAAKPGSHYRQLFVKGTRIAARVLYSLYIPGDDWPGQTCEEIAAGFSLPLEAVREAIAYCETDPAEVREDWEREEAFVMATGMNDKTHHAPKSLSPEDYSRIFLR